MLRLANHYDSPLAQHGKSQGQINGIARFYFGAVQDVQVETFGLVGQGVLEEGFLYFPREIGRFAPQDV